MARLARAWLLSLRRATHTSRRGRLMFESFAALFPANWQAAVLALTAPLRWLAEWQPALARLMYYDRSTLAMVAVSALLLVPVLVVAAGSWCTMLSLYTIPFRSGRGQFLTTLLMTWW